MLVLCLLPHSLSLSPSPLPPPLPIILPPPPIHTHIDTESEPPQNLVTTPTNISVTVEWAPPLDANGVISSYLVDLFNSSDDEIDTARVNNSGALEHMFMDLLPYTNYSVKVRAVTGDMGDILGQVAEDSFITDIGSKENCSLSPFPPSLSLSLSLSLSFSPSLSSSPSPSLSHTHTFFLCAFLLSSFPAFMFFLFNCTVSCISRFLSQFCSTNGSQQCHDNQWNWFPNCIMDASRPPQCSNRQLYHTVLRDRLTNGTE